MSDTYFIETAPNEYWYIDRTADSVVRPDGGLAAAERFKLDPAPSGTVRFRCLSDGTYVYVVRAADRAMAGVSQPGGSDTVVGVLCGGASIEQAAEIQLVQGASSTVQMVIYNGVPKPNVAVVKRYYEAVAVFSEKDQSMAQVFTLVPAPAAAQGVRDARGAAIM
jgi:hypothetical protein